ncbi:MAG: AAC(3) family N-acetyltransferase [Burkholderiales bacterium]|nr:AAC(3) family N-acetyltransferase [Anaerolineae bacterium]
MPESDVINPDLLPLTIESLMEQFAACGLTAGQTVIVHTSMSALGWVAGGAAAIIPALLNILTPSGTLMMPTFTPDNNEPALWDDPPMPEHWWPIIRQHTPAYDLLTTPTWGVGKVAELFRSWPGVIRSANPGASFAALGPNAEYLTENDTSIEVLFGDDSPIGKLYELDAYVFLLGVDHGKNTSLHLAEYRANIPRSTVREGTAMLVDGVRQWVEYDLQDLFDDDFPALGAAYEAEYHIPRRRVGKGEAHFTKQRPLVDFGVKWLEKNRPKE